MAFAEISCARTREGAHGFCCAFPIRRSSRRTRRVAGTRGETMTYDEFFVTATGASQGPFPFQRRFATSDVLPSAVNIPTGLGKTAMAVIGWLWRRRGSKTDVRESTPRRLVYCLPMRTLVEQTRDSAVAWLSKLGIL